MLERFRNMINSDFQLKGRNEQSSFLFMILAFSSQSLNLEQNFKKHFEGLSCSLWCSHSKCRPPPQVPDDGAASWTHPSTNGPARILAGTGIEPGVYFKATDMHQRVPCALTAMN